MLFSETEWGAHLYGAVVGAHHTIVDVSTGSEAFFDLRADPEEMDDRANRNDSWQGGLASMTRAHRRELQQDPGRLAVIPIPSVSASDRAKLEALGYVDP